MVTYHCGSAVEPPADKPLLAKLHQDLNTYFLSRLATAPLIYIKAQMDSGATPGTVAPAWRGFRFGCGSTAKPGIVTEAESVGTGLVVMSDRAHMDSVKQIVNDALLCAHERACRSAHRAATAAVRPFWNMF